MHLIMFTVNKSYNMSGYIYTGQQIVISVYSFIAVNKNPPRITVNDSTTITDTPASVF